MERLRASKTKQRRAILDALGSVVTHPTADDIHHMVREHMPRISLGTVYRNLEMMSEAGLILKLNIDGHQKRYDGNTTPHYHIRCCECGRVDDVDMQPVGAIEQAAADASGYQVLSHTVDFVGVCPGCAGERQEWQKDSQ